MRKLGITLLAMACALVAALPAIAQSNQAGVTFLWDGGGLKYGVDGDLKDLHHFNDRTSLWINGVVAKDTDNGESLWFGGGLALRYRTKTDVTLSAMVGGTANLIEHSIGSAPALWYVGFGASWKF